MLNVDSSTEIVVGCCLEHVNVQVYAVRSGKGETFVVAFIGGGMHPVQCGAGKNAQFEGTRTRVTL